MSSVLPRLKDGNFTALKPTIKTFIPLSSDASSPKGSTRRSVTDLVIPLSARAGFTHAAASNDVPRDGEAELSLL